LKQAKHWPMSLNLSSDDIVALEEKLREWRKGGPALFAKEALGATPTEQQWEASKNIVEKRKVSIRSGHGTGKSGFMAWSVLWFIQCFFPCKIPCTAPTSHQLSDILWAEIAKWHSVYKERIPHLAKEFVWSSEKFYMADRPQESFAVARTSRPEKPEALQGFHSDYILFLIDEASGVAEKVFEVAEGALSTEGAYVLMAANPTREDGYFYDSHHKMRSRWAALHWDGEKSPLVSQGYIDDMRLKYGVDSPIYQVRVKGNFATAADGVIPLGLCIDAQNRDVVPIESARIIWGLDVARFGDDSTALAKRQGNVQLEVTKEWYGKDTMQTVGLVVQEYQAAVKKPDSICVDVIGIGAGVVDRLRELGLPVVGVNVAESPSIGDKYQRQRDELWFSGREWLAARDCNLLEDEELIAELTTAKYSILSNGKIKVEGKDEMKRRGVKSPNRADAWLLTFATASASNWNAKLNYPSLGIM
jgi:phage terminase large subunit